MEKAGSTKKQLAVCEEMLNQGYPQELKHFIECVREDKQPVVTGEDGRAVLELIYAAYRWGKRSGCRSTSRWRNRLICGWGDGVLAEM